MSVPLDDDTLGWKPRDPEDTALPRAPVQTLGAEGGPEARRGADPQLTLGDAWTPRTSAQRQDTRPAPGPGGGGRAVSQKCWTREVPCLGDR